MNAAHVHLLVNHLPIFALIFGILMLIAGLVFRHSVLDTAGFLLFVLSGMGTFIAMRSGEAAEELLEQIPGVSHQLIHHHEEHAEIFFWLSISLSLLSLVTFLLQKRNHQLLPAAKLIVLIFALATSAYSLTVGNSGGQIRHPEIRKDFTFPPAASDSRTDHSDHNHEEKNDDHSH